MTFNLNNVTISVIGLGYVGLPLAIEFAKKYNVTGFDIDNKRIESLKKGIDSTLEVESCNLNSALNSANNSKIGLKITGNINDIKTSNVYIITVPTPVDKHKTPDFTPLIKASETVGKIIKKGDIVIYESTVYPGATEEVCIPVIEKISQFSYNKDFFAGYSPERINPGDKVRTFANIKKVTSGSNADIADFVDKLYNSVLLNGTFKASSIKVAEASKVIENAQRDLNISFVNELAIIFDKIGIDTNDVLDAAATKWNFIKYKPGLVGGHCIGVDPYYLKFKAESVGYHPDIISSGRRVNDGMGQFIADKTIKLLIKKGGKVLNANVLILGFTFKENCPDIRNTKVIDVVDELKEFGCNTTVYDPWANKNDVKKEYNIDIVNEKPDTHFDAIILAVAHEKFNEIDFEYFHKKGTVIFDSKAFINFKWVDGRL